MNRPENLMDEARVHEGDGRQCLAKPHGVGENGARNFAKGWHKSACRSPAAHLATRLAARGAGALLVDRRPPKELDGLALVGLKALREATHAGVAPREGALGDGVRHE